jgi:hypothetical protein
MLLATLLVTSQVLYIADTTTFGCTSNTEVTHLEHVRTSRKAFRAELIEQIFQGQCVEIAKGTVVEGAIGADGSILLVDSRIEPPGFLVPLRDFHKWKKP